MKQRNRWILNNEANVLRNEMFKGGKNASIEMNKFINLMTEPGSLQSV
jgi:hypothetical protein